MPSKRWMVAGRGDKGGPAPSLTCTGCDGRRDGPPATRSSLRPLCALSHQLVRINEMGKGRGGAPGFSPLPGIGLGSQILLRP